MHDTTKSPHGQRRARGHEGNRISEPLKDKGIRISKIELLPVSIPTGKGSLATALHCVVCKIHTDSGHVGISETGATSAFYNGEVQGSIIGIIGDVIGPQALIGQDPTRLEYLIS